MAKEDTIRKELSRSDAHPWNGRDFIISLFTYNGEVIEVT